MCFYLKQLVSYRNIKVNRKAISKIYSILRVRGDLKFRNKTVFAIKCNNIFSKYIGKTKDNFNTLTIASENAVINKLLCSSTIMDCACY